MVPRALIFAALRFNPRARAGRDADDFAAIAEGLVSIHAPARGATERGGDLDRVRSVSIHAPARGATNAPKSSRASRIVSIHAPARGATRPALRLLAHALVSIHAPARGATDVGDMKVYPIEFQSTRPRGARRERIRERKPQLLVSIHAPARGATVCQRPPRRVFPVSIHAPARGATGILACLRCRRYCFNPRARAGRDLPYRAESHLVKCVSIHAPARGATHII